VYAYHNNPVKLDEEEKQNGKIIESLPEKPETGPNKTTQLYYNPQTEKCFYETKQKKQEDKNTNAGTQNQQFQKEVIQRLNSIETKLDRLVSKVD